jgi:hypothetical protein
MGRVDKIKFWVFIFLRLSIIAAGTVALFDKNWTYLGIAVLSLLVMFLPAIIEKRFHVDIPDELEIVLILFMYASIFLGEAHRFYDKFWWWDKMLHSLSGLILGNIGVLIVTYLNRSSRVKMSLSPVFVALFSFFFAVAMGTVWEIYEFAVDKATGSFMQRGSLDDTMIDLILDTIGASIFAILGYFHQKGKINIISKCITKLESSKQGEKI